MRFARTLTLAWLCGAASLGHAFGQTANVVLTGGKIVTVDDQF